MVPSKQKRAILAAEAVRLARWPQQVVAVAARAFVAAACDLLRTGSDWQLEQGQRQWHSGCGGARVERAHSRDWSPFAWWPLSSSQFERALSLACSLARLLSPQPPTSHLVSCFQLQALSLSESEREWPPNRPNRKLMLPAAHPKPGVSLDFQTYFSLLLRLPASQDSAKSSVLRPV